VRRGAAREGAEGQGRGCDNDRLHEVSPVCSGANPWPHTAVPAG
jgi:hypothetical protein